MRPPPPPPPLWLDNKSLGFGSPDLFIHSNMTKMLDPTPKIESFIHIYKWCWNWEEWKAGDSVFLFSSNFVRILNVAIIRKYV
jgi:hypothetical protein